MKLYDQFLNFAKTNGIDMNEVYHQREEGYDLVTFAEKANKDNNSIYNVVFVFYDEDNIAEIYIRKHVSVEDKLSVFEKLNLFNSKYRGMSFFLDNEMVCAKSYCATGGDIQVALLMLARNMETAQELFAEFI